MAKANAVTSVTWHEDGTATVEAVGAGKFVFDPKRCHEALHEKAKREGWTKRIVNAAAIERDPATGRSATPQEKFEAMQKVGEHLMSGTDQWEMRAGRAADDGGTVLLAMVRLFGLSVDQANVKVTALAEKRGIDRAAAIALFASAEDVAQEVQRIKAERAMQRAKAAGVGSAADLLSELGSDDDPK